MTERPEAPHLDDTSRANRDRAIAEANDLRQQNAEFRHCLKKACDLIRRRRSDKKILTWAHELLAGKVP